MTPVQLGPGDLVASWGEVAEDDRKPLAVVDELRSFMDRHQLGTGELRLEPIGEGRSNVTLLVRRGDSAFVLRRPPRGAREAGAHDVLREAGILASVQGEVPAPKVLAVCAEESVIGSPFFIMDYVPGFVIADSMPAALDPPAAREAACDRLVDTLALIHRVDWRARGISYRGGYLGRQLKLFGSIWEGIRHRDIPSVEFVARRLAATMPVESEPALVHGDYRLGNVIFAAGETPRIAAVLDWEMSTVGDPLADLGYLTSLWPSAGDPPIEGLDEFVGVLRAEGVPDREAVIQRYASLLDRDLDEIEWYRALALWKAAIFMEGNFVRAGSGAGDEWHVAVYQRSAPLLAELAAEICRRSNPRAL